MTITALPYEILRREDGRCALSVNAGLIDFAPKNVYVIQDDFVILNDEFEPRYKLCKVPDDVRKRLLEDGYVGLFEFMCGGVFCANQLRLTPAPAA